ncbi:MAG TPA: hypothetical protein VEW03_04065 [Longimicrobiaceae bacterium]|nr:hypothetical protein [Longimicrobiaceae bacterium]
MLKHAHATLTAAACAALLAGCSGDATGPSGSGDATMQAAAIGDDPPASPAAAGSGPSFNHNGASGTVDFQARIYVQTSAGAWTELTSGAWGSGTVDASGHGSAVVFATSRVAAGGYARVRVVFQEVRANMSGSLVVSSGLLSGSVTVDMQSDGSVTVERQVSASASAGGTTRLLVNLNAGAWLNQANASTHTVSESDFASAVAVTAS